MLWQRHWQCTTVPGTASASLTASGNLEWSNRSRTYLFIGHYTVPNLRATVPKLSFHFSSSTERTGTSATGTGTIPSTALTQVLREKILLFFANVARHGEDIRPTMFDFLDIAGEGSEGVVAIGTCKHADFPVPSYRFAIKMIHNHNKETPSALQRRRENEVEIAIALARSTPTVSRLLDDDGAEVAHFLLP